MVAGRNSAIAAITSLIVVGFRSRSPHIVERPSSWKMPSVLPLLISW